MSADMTAGVDVAVFIAPVADSAAVAGDVPGHARAARVRGVSPQVPGDGAAIGVPLGSPLEEPVPRHSVRAASEAAWDVVARTSSTRRGGRGHQPDQERAPHDGGGTRAATSSFRPTIPLAQRPSQPRLL